MKTLFGILLFSTFALVASAQDKPNLFQRLLRPAPAQKPPQQGTAPQAQRQQTPKIGAFGEVPLEQEVAIGKQLAGDLLGAVPLVRDDNLQSYVNKIGRWIASHSERKDLNWYFGVLDTPDINAFALPGGYVFVTRGLYSMLSTEAELAGVLAHEIGHVLMKHHIKVLQQSMLVGLAGGLATRRVAKDGKLTSAVVRNLLGNGALIIARGLDKEAEFEADRIGVVLATRAGYYPYGLPIVLQMLERINPADGSVALLFKTHPPAHERLVRLGDAMEAAFDQYADGKDLSDRFASVQTTPAERAQPDRPDRQVSRSAGSGPYAKLEELRSRALLLGFDGAMALAHVKMGRNIDQDIVLLNAQLQRLGISDVSYPADPWGAKANGDPFFAFARRIISSLGAVDRRMQDAFVVGWAGVITSVTPSLKPAGFDLRKLAHEAGLPARPEMTDPKYVQWLANQARSSISTRK